MTPRWWRATRERRTKEPTFPWLTKDAQDVIYELGRGERVNEPVRWRNRLQWFLNLRRVQMGPRTFEALSAGYDVLWGHPLQDPGFLSHLGAVSPTTGIGDRTSAMRYLFSDLLPDELLARPTKGRFSEVFWGPQTLEYARAWDGDGVDTSIVDVEGLKREWSQPLPRQTSGLLLHQVWLSKQGSTAEGI